MSELGALRTFYRFNSRVRKKYLETILGLPPEERLKDRGASHPSLQEIYVHVLEALHWWLEYVPQDRVGEVRELSGRELTPDQLRTETERADRIALDYLEGLSESDLTKEMTCRFPSRAGPPQEAHFPIGDVLWHMVEEELQHRGELNALLWQMDTDPPIGRVEDWNASKIAQ